MRKLFFFSLLLLACSAYADMPGAKARPPLYLKAENTKGINGYTIFYQYDYGAFKGKMSDSTYYVAGGRGRPDMIYIWARNNADTTSCSDTISFWGGSQNTVIRFESVTNGKLMVSKRDYTRKEAKELRKKTSGFGIFGEDDGMTTLLLISASLSAILLFLLLLRRRRLMQRA